jgi:hypothetical protein
MRQEVVLGLDYGLQIDAPSPFFLLSKLQLATDAN